MAHPGGRDEYVVSFENGSSSGALDLDTLREMISGGLVGVRDRVAKNRSEPTEYFLYDELVDLWDVESATFDIGGDPRDDLTSLSVPPAEPDIGARDSGFTMQPVDLSLSGTAPAVDIKSDSGLGAAAAAQTVMTAAPGVEGSAQSLLPETNDLLDDIAAMLDFEMKSSGGSAPAVSPESTFPGDGAVYSDSEVAFAGYDALSDNLLDPVTVRDLLFEASLYTALAVSHEATDDDLNDAYLRRAELIAQRQRNAKMVELDQVAALEDIRRLVFQCFEYLRDGARRKDYDRRGNLDGIFPPAAPELDLTPMDPNSAEFRNSGTFAAVGRAKVKSRRKGESSDDLSKYSSGASTLPLTSGEMVPRRSGSFASLQPPDLSEGTTQGAGRISSMAGPRVYTSPHKAIESGEISTLGVTDAVLFRDEAPTTAREQLEREEAARAKRGKERTRSLSARAAAIVGPGDAITWSSETDKAGTGFLQSVLGTMIVAGISIVVVTMTTMGDGEFAFANPSSWFYGRNALLLAVALIGSFAVRRESVRQLGVRPAILWAMLAIFIGTALGLVGSMVAPIRIADPPYAIIVSSFLIQAICQEVYFRGFVTRTLLLEMASPLLAIALSCLMYGVFYLSFRLVLAQEGFFQLYYSILLYGFGLGGIFGWLYYKSKSMWPGMIAHFLTFFFAFLASPVK